MAASESGVKRELEEMVLWASSSLEALRTELTGVCPLLLEKSYRHLIRQGNETLARDLLSFFQKRLLSPTEYLSILSTQEDASVIHQPEKHKKKRITMSSMGYRVLQNYLIDSRSVFLTSILNSEFSFRLQEYPCHIDPMEVMEVSDPQPVSLACVVPGRQGIGSKRIRPWQQERDSNKTPTIVTPDIRNDQFFTNLLDNVILPQMLMNETVEDMAKKMVMSVGGTEEKDVESPPSILFSTFTNTYGDMACLKLAEDAKMALAGCASSVLVWDWASRESHLEPYSFAEVLPNRSNAPSVSTVTHSSVSMDTATASEIPLELIGHSHRVCGVSLEEFSQEHRYVLSSSVDETVRLWDVSSRSCLARYTSISGVPWSVEFGPFGHHFVTGNQSGAAVLYSTDRAVPLRVFRGHTSDVSCSRFHPNAVYVATGSDDGYVRLWDIRDTVTGSVRVFKPPRRGAGGVTAVCWSPCGTLLGAGFEDGSAAIWEVSDGRSVFYLSDTSEPRAKRRNKSNPVHCMQFNHNSSAVITGGQDCAMKLWDFSAFQNDAKISNDTKLSGFRDSSSVFAGYLLSPHSSFHTKFSPIYAMSGFNSENGVVFAGGPSQLSFEA